jgi:hypothetical protein
LPWDAPRADRHTSATGADPNNQEDEMDRDNNETIGGYQVPVDPMDDLQCDSCQ